MAIVFDDENTQRKKIVFDDEVPPQSMMDKAQGLYSAYKESPLYKASPVGMLNTANEMIGKGFNVAGEKTAEYLGGKQVNPNIAAGVGTVIQMAPDIAMAVAPLFGMKPPVPKMGMFEKMGAKGINASAGIRSKTIQAMAGKENPTIFGAKLGKSLSEEGAIGFGPSSTFDKSKGILEKYGQDVQKAIVDIKSTGKPVDLPAEEALTPLFNEIQTAKDATFSSNRALARPFREAYDKLWKVSKDGKLNLDNIREVMKETGEAMGRAGRDTPKEAAYSELYGVLARVRDGMVNKIAEMAQNPKLAENLKKANAGYSKYSRLMPDIRSSSAKEGVKGLPLFSPVKSLVESTQPLISKGLLKSGKILPSVPRAEVMASGAIAANSATKKPKRIKQGEHIYILNEATGEYE